MTPFPAAYQTLFFFIFFIFCFQIRFLWPLSVTGKLRDAAHPHLQCGCTMTHQQTPSKLSCYSLPPTQPRPFLTTTTEVRLRGEEEGQTGGIGCKWWRNATAELTGGGGGGEEEGANNSHKNGQGITLSNPNFEGSPYRNWAKEKHTRQFAGHTR